MLISDRGWKYLLTVTLIVIAVPSAADGESVDQAKPTSIFIVRHTETDQSPPTLTLTTAGRQRAELLVHTFRDIKLTHIFASHTSWARETVAAVALAQALRIIQLPAPGSVLDGRPVTDETSRRAPIEPMAAALAQLPAGSVALAALNGENIFAILNRLGVPVASNGQCSTGSMCVPCIDNKCFPQKEFDRIWFLLRETGRPDPLAFLELRYGAGWQRPPKAKKD